jgi:hypothetical protein
MINYCLLRVLSGGHILIINAQLGSMCITLSPLMWIHIKLWSDPDITDSSFLPNSTLCTIGYIKRLPLSTSIPSNSFIASLACPFQSPLLVRVSHSSPLLLPLWVFYEIIVDLSVSPWYMLAFFFLGVNHDTCKSSLFYS